MSTQNILITGATSGIGREAALYLARAGHTVFATGRDPAALASLTEEGAALSLHALPLDVTSAESIAAAKAEISLRTDGHGVDVLINNAGYGQVGPVVLIAEDDIRRQFETNVIGLMAVTRAFLPAMQARRRGRILNVSSIGGRLVTPFMGVYHASKYAVEALSDAMRIELAPLGIQVVLIEPGVIKSAFGERAMQQAESYLDQAGAYAPVVARADEIRADFEAWGAHPSVIARAMERAITARRPRARYVAPFHGRVAVTLTAWLPTWLVDWAMRTSMGLNPRSLAVSTPTASAVAA